MATPPDFLFWYKARVVNVVDGDTLDLGTDLGFRIAFRQWFPFAAAAHLLLDSPEPHPAVGDDHELPREAILELVENRRHRRRDPARIPGGEADEDDPCW